MQDPRLKITANVMAAVLYNGSYGHIKAAEVDKTALIKWAK